MAASVYEYEDGLQSSIEEGIAYDPSYVPDPVKSFVVHLCRHIREKNVYEINQMYETSFHTLIDRMFKDTPWPSVEAVAQYVDNDHVFCLLYHEMWYRHLYARLSPTLKQRIDSWDNYCSLFQARYLSHFSCCLFFHITLVLMLIYLSSEFFAGFIIYDLLNGCNFSFLVFYSSLLMNVYGFLVCT